MVALQAEGQGQGSDVPCQTLPQLTRIESEMNGESVCDFPLSGSCGSSFILKDFIRWKASRLLLCKAAVLLEQTRLYLVISDQTLCTLASLCAGTGAKSNIIVLFQNLAAFLLLECGP